jgi:16S rRNA C967 or C1407 C5-methylase (RsmB/RsmF family)
MGRSWRRRNKKKHNKTAGENAGSSDNDKTAHKNNGDDNEYAMVEYGNYRMESYYAYQGIHDKYLEKEVDDDGNIISFEFVDCTSPELKEEERQRWLAAMKGTLPASFRIGSDVDIHLRERLEHELNEMVGQKLKIEVEPRGGKLRNQDSTPETKLVAPAQKVQFIPHAYQLSLDRQTIRRNPKLEPFHDWLKVQTEAGFITRQETVSMIPPVVLDPEPHHMILDMAAAPGSKTSQLLERVNFPSKTGDREPTGCVVANDSDPKRAYMLTHQIRRINSPAVFITSCDARHFPVLKYTQNENKVVSEGIFDRVLADVPCSGDGTMFHRVFQFTFVDMCDSFRICCLAASASSSYFSKGTTRKNPGIWKSWSSLNGYSLHPLQLAIALRGAKCTKVGGYLCYSTCSMNPIENEAVVAALLRAAEGSLELVDRRSELKGLVARPGLSTWKNLAHEQTNRQIKDKQKKVNEKMQARRKEWEERQDKENGEAQKAEEGESSTGGAKNDGAVEHDEGCLSIRTKYEPQSLDDKEQLKRMVELVGMTEYKSFEDVPRGMQKKVLASCFPPDPDETIMFHLERCMRIMPQDMNTGGFFVALLKKVAPLNTKARARFMALEDQLEKDCSMSVMYNGEVDDRTNIVREPDLKKPKLDDDGKIMDGSLVDIKDDNGRSSECDETEFVHGFLKRDFLVDKDGKRSKTVGKDDFVPIPEEIFEPLKDYYGIDEESFRKGQFATRAGGDRKVLHFITKTIKTQLIDKKLQEKVTVITTGLKAFVRNSKDCEISYRVSQEGIHLVAPHMNKRKLLASFSDFETCLKTDTVDIKEFSEGFGEEIRALSMGSFVVCLKGYENDYIKKLMLVMWRCRSDSVKFLVTQAEIDGMRSKLRAIKKVA